MVSKGIDSFFKPVSSSSGKKRSPRRPKRSPLKSSKKRKIEKPAFAAGAEDVFDFTGNGSSEEEEPEEQEEDSKEDDVIVIDSDEDENSSSTMNKQKCKTKSSKGERSGKKRVRQKKNEKLAKNGQRSSHIKDTSSGDEHGGMSEESDFTPDDESDYEPAPKKKTPQTKKLTKRSQTKAKFSAKQEKASSETRKKKLTPKKNQIPTPQKNHVVKKREAKSPKKKDSAGSAIKSSTKKGKRETLEKIPLFLPKQQQAMLLIQIDEESMQLGGEVGAVGRLKASKRKGLKIDLKGHSYKGKFYQTAGSLAIVSVGPDEARLEAVSDSLVKLVHESSIFDSEKMLRGTLEAGDSQDVDFDVNEEWRKEEAEKKKKKRQEKAKKKRAAKA